MYGKHIRMRPEPIGQGLRQVHLQQHLVATSQFRYIQAKQIRIRVIEFQENMQRMLPAGELAS
jgi:hypothetical protein